MFAFYHRLKPLPRLPAGAACCQVAGDVGLGKQPDLHTALYLCQVKTGEAVSLSANEYHDNVD